MTVWPPLVLSLQISLLATALVALIAIPLAFAMARRHFPGKSLGEALIMLPLVLPPTVVGYVIIASLGAQSPVGRFLKQHFDYSLLFTVEGAVLAAAVVALPMLYIPAKAAFAGVDRDLEDTARLMGAGPLQLFWHVSLPLARRGIGSGLILAFARALGEFGATVMVFGWREQGRQTLPITIYAAWDGGEPHTASAAVAALSVLSFLLILTYNASSAGKQE